MPPKRSSKQWGSNASMTSTSVLSRADRRKIISKKRSAPPPHVVASTTKPNATSNEKRRYAAEQKQFTNKTWCQLYKQMNATDTPVSPLVKGHDEIYTRDETEKIRLMANVESSPLEVSHSFKDKPELMLRIAKYANVRNIQMTVQKSCTMKYEVAGPQFFVAASNSANGWIVCIKCCREDNDYTEKSLRSPFTGLWLGKILLPHLEFARGCLLVHAKSTSGLCHHWFGDRQSAPAGTQLGKVQVVQKSR